MISRLLMPMVVLLALASCEQTPRAASKPGPQEVTEESIRRQVASCWLVDLGLPGLEDMEVAIKAELDPDGSVKSASTVIGTDKLTDLNYIKFAESARRAVLKCSPYKFPATKPYDDWKTVIFNFNMKDMGLE